MKYTLVIAALLGTMSAEEITHSIRKHHEEGGDGEQTAPPEENTGALAQVKSKSKT